MNIIKTKLLFLSLIFALPGALFCIEKTTPSPNHQQSKKLNLKWKNAYKLGKSVHAELTSLSTYLWFVLLWIIFFGLFLLEYKKCSITHHHHECQNKTQTRSKHLQNQLYRILFACCLLGMLLIPPIAIHNMSPKEKKEAFTTQKLTKESEYIINYSSDYYLNKTYPAACADLILCYRKHKNNSTFSDIILLKTIRSLAKHHQKKQDAKNRPYRRRPYRGAYGLGSSACHPSCH